MTGNKVYHFELKISFQRQFQAMRRVLPKKNSATGNNFIVQQSQPSGVHGSIRAGVVKTSLSSVLRSKLFIFSLLILASVTIALLDVGREQWTAALIIVGLVATAYGWCNWRSLIFEILLVDNMIHSILGVFEWYSTVDENLYLGAVPMQPDIDRLLREQRVEALLSVVEPHEVDCETLVGRPVSPMEWKHAGLRYQLSIPTADFFPPPFDALEQGADFINTHLSEGRKVYVHCKSGRGRSASMVMAYFIRYKKDAPETAFAKLKLRRPLIFDQKSAHMKHLIHFAEQSTPQSR